MKGFHSLMKSRLSLKQWLLIIILCTVLVPILVVKLTGNWYSNMATTDDGYSIEWVQQRILAQRDQWESEEWQIKLEQDSKKMNVGIRLLDRERREIFSNVYDEGGYILEEGGDITPKENVGDFSEWNVLNEFYVYSSTNTLTGMVYIQDQGPVLRSYGSLAEKMIMEYGGFVIWGGLLSTILLTGAWFLNKQVLKPLKKLGQAAQGISRSEFCVDLPSSRVKEVHEVSAGFKKMRAELEHSLIRQQAMEEERRLFIASIVHDIRTPVFAIRGYLEGLENGVAFTPEKTQRYIRNCRIKADVLNHLVTDLLTYTKLDWFEDKPTLASTRMDGLLNELILGYQEEANRKQISLALSLPEQGAEIMTDPYLLQRAFGNLLDNALRYTPEGGSIEVKATCGNGIWAIAVLDTGPGISSSDLQHLFKPLYRGEQSRNRKTGGAGLGLSIVWKITEILGGRVQAGNRPEGGSVFTVSLPLNVRR